MTRIIKFFVKTLINANKIYKFPLNNVSRLLLILYILFFNVLLEGFVNNHHRLETPLFSSDFLLGVFAYITVASLRLGKRMTKSNCGS